MSIARLAGSPSGVIPEPDSPDHPPQHRAPWALVGSLVAASWAIPALCHLIGIDVLLPLLVLGLTASLLRSGRTLLDRLVLATGSLFGVITGLGLVWSYWPFGLHPVALAGTAFTGLTVIAVVTRRKPSLPRPRLTDGIAFVGALAATSTVVWPLLSRGTAGQIAIMTARDDFARQMSLFKGIRELGGYVFLHPGDSQVLATVPPSMLQYPPGSHLLYGALDNFLRSSTASGGPQGDFTHLLWFSTVGVFLMVITTLWAMRWIAGARLAGWRFMVPAAIAAGYAGFGEPVFEFACGHTSATAGIALMAILTGVLARPLRCFGEQLLLISTMLIGIAFTYYLFLPAAALATLGWLIVNRRRVLAHRRATMIAAGMTCLLAPVLPIFGLLAGQAEAMQAQSSLFYSREFTLSLALLVAAGLASRIGRRLPAFRGYGWVLICVVAEAAIASSYQMYRYGDAGYYFDKLLWMVNFIALIGLGTLTSLLPHPQPNRAGTPLLSRLAGVIPAACATLAIIAGLGLVKGDSPYRPMRYDSKTFGKWFLEGGSPAPAVQQYIQRGQSKLGDFRGSPLMVIAGSNIDSYLTGLYIAAMAGELGTSEKSTAAALDLPNVTALAPAERAAEMSKRVDMAKKISTKISRKYAKDAAKPLRVAVTEPEVAAGLRELKIAQPDLKLVIYEM